MKSKFRRKVKEEWQGRRIYPPILETQGWAIKRTSEDGFSWFASDIQSNNCIAEIIFSVKREAENYKKFKLNRLPGIKDKVVRVKDKVVRVIVKEV